MTNLFATPFPARTAEHNVANAWVRKGAFIVPAHYGDPVQEALAARVSAIVTDISPREDVRFFGAGAAAFVSAPFASDFGTLVANASARVRWCADGGGLRGSGKLYRFGKADFLLRSFDTDFAWFAASAARFETSLRDTTAERGLLLIAGPYALPVLAAAGIEESLRLEPGHHAVSNWQDLAITLFRMPSGNAYQLSCAPDDAPAVFDRLSKRGKLFGLRLAGATALDVLQLERGVALPGIDWHPAREPFAGAQARDCACIRRWCAGRECRRAPRGRWRDSRSRRPHRGSAVSIIRRGFPSTG